ncbi:MAG: M48 family metalloprotease, partial [Chitinophagaceae bacterium]|nr:M48 family metalloprotease [Chitinophagaceae bacterium]
IMKKLIKEIGLSALITISTSGGDSEIIKEVLKKLTASAYDRTLEKEADLKAVEYLKNADISAEPFANFLYEIALRQGDEPRYLTWINTHPDTKERAAYILEKSKEYRVINKPVLTPSSWKKLKAILQE